LLGDEEVKKGEVKKEVPRKESIANLNKTKKEENGKIVEDLTLQEDSNKGQTLRELYSMQGIY